MSQTSAPVAGTARDDNPLNEFASCHQGILAHLDSLRELPALLDPAARARSIAQDTLRFFHEAVFDHHRDEEKELFPAVLARAAAGAQHNHVYQLVEQLTAEHRAIEAQWRKMEPELQKAARGEDNRLDDGAVADLVSQYRTHARMEEQIFLPLCAKILGEESAEMQSLGLALHLRHAARDWRRHGLRGS